MTKDTTTVSPHVREEDRIVLTGGSLSPESGKKLGLRREVATTVCHALSLRLLAYLTFLYISRNIQRFSV